MFYPTRSRVRSVAIRNSSHLNIYSTLDTRASKSRVHCRSPRNTPPTHLSPTNKHPALSRTPDIEIRVLRAKLNCLHGDGVIFIHPFPHFTGLPQQFSHECYAKRSLRVYPTLVRSHVVAWCFHHTAAAAAQPFNVVCDVRFQLSDLHFTSATT